MYCVSKPLWFVPETCPPLFSSMFAWCTDAETETLQRANLYPRNHCVAASVHCIKAEPRRPWLNAINGKKLCDTPRMYLGWQGGWLCCLNLENWWSWVIPPFTKSKDHPYISQYGIFGLENHPLQSNGLLQMSSSPFGDHFMPCSYFAYLSPRTGIEWKCT